VDDLARLRSPTLALAKNKKRKIPLGKQKRYRRPISLGRRQRYWGFMDSIVSSTIATVAFLGVAQVGAGDCDAHADSEPRPSRC